MTCYASCAVRFLSCPWFHCWNLNPEPPEISAGTCAEPFPPHCDEICLCGAELFRPLFGTRAPTDRTPARCRAAQCAHVGFTSSAATGTARRARSLSPPSGKRAKSMTCEQTRTGSSKTRKNKMQIRKPPFLRSACFSFPENRTLSITQNVRLHRHHARPGTGAEGILVSALGM